MFDLAHAEFNCSILLHGIIHSGKGIHTVPLYELLVIDYLIFSVKLTVNYVQFIRSRKLVVEWQ